MNVRHFLSCENQYIIEWEKSQDKNEKSVDYPGQILQVFNDDGSFSVWITLFVIFQEHFFLFSRLNQLFLHAAILRLKLNLNRITVENKLQLSISMTNQKALIL